MPKPPVPSKSSQCTRSAVEATARRSSLPNLLLHAVMRSSVHRRSRRSPQKVHHHLIPLGLTEPGDYDALGPEGRQVFLFDALSTPRTPHAIHPHEVPDLTRPGFPPHTRLHAQPCAAHPTEPSAQRASLTPNRHRASSQWESGTLDASPPPSVSVTNRNVRAGEQPNHKLRVRPRQPEVFLSQSHCTSYKPSASRFRRFPGC